MLSRSLFREKDILGGGEMFEICCRVLLSDLLGSGDGLLNGFSFAINDRGELKLSW